jgi:hypothetical protein
MTSNVIGMATVQHIRAQPNALRRLGFTTIVSPVVNFVPEK